MQGKSHNPWKIAMIVVILVVLLGGARGATMLSGLGDTAKQSFCTTHN